MKLCFRSFFLCFLMLLGGCQNTQRYSVQQDSAPLSPYNEPSMQDALPRYEPYREINGRAYTIRGITYKPFVTGKGYVEEGGASWYGQKFHGHLTANGEIYDMFAMTAAHRTLPLPSFIRVTNLENGAIAVVRVNDRGPFHSERIVDLSYAAAKKLGFHQKGTARVKLETIFVDIDQQVFIGDKGPIPLAEYARMNTPQNPMDPPRETPPVFIQVAALSDAARAQQLSSVLSELYQVPMEMPLIENVYRLRLGPIYDLTVVTELLESLKRNGYPNAYTITTTM